MASKGKGMLNKDWNWFFNIILTIIPITHYILGAITRFKRGKILGGILNLIPAVAQIFWIIDIITMFFSKDLVIFAK